GWDGRAAVGFAIQCARIAATFGTVLAAAFVSGCASGPGRLFQDRELSVQATPEAPRNGIGPFGWFRAPNPVTAPVTRVQPATAVVDGSGTSPRSPFKRFDPQALLAGARSTRLGEWLGRKVHGSAVTQAAEPQPAGEAAGRASLKPGRARAAPPVDRASRLARGGTIATLPVGIQAHVAPLVDGDDRRTSYEEETSRVPAPTAHTDGPPPGL